MSIPAWAQRARKINQDNNRHWFDPDTIRFFGTKFHGEPTLHGVFITSEWTGFDRSERWFNVRRLINGGASVETLNDFTDPLLTLAEAKKFVGEIEEVES